MGDSPGVILSLSKLRKRFSVQFGDEKNVFGFISRSGEEVEFRATESDSGVYTIVKGNFDLLKGTETVGESDEISCLDLALIWAESEDLPQGDEAKFWGYVDWGRGPRTRLSSGRGGFISSWQSLRTSNEATD